MSKTVLLKVEWSPAEGFLYHANFHMERSSSVDSLYLVMLGARYVILMANCSQQCLATAWSLSNWRRLCIERHTLSSSHTIPQELEVAVSLRLFASRVEEITARAEGDYVTRSTSPGLRHQDYVTSEDQPRRDKNESASSTEGGVWASLPAALVAAAGVTWHFNECHGPAVAATDAASSAHRQATDAEVRVIDLCVKYLSCGCT